MPTERERQLLNIIADPVLKTGHKLTLVVLALSDGLVMHELLARMGMKEIRRATMQRYLQVLEDRGFVDRRRTEGSGSAFVYSLTAFYRL